MRFAILAILLAFAPLALIAQTTAIPDPVFEQALINAGYDSGVPDGSVPTANISGITALDISSEPITDLTGLQDFTALTVIDIRYCNFTSIDLSGNLLLEELRLTRNRLLSLDVSANLQLKDIELNYNYLAELDVAHLSALEVLQCAANQLTSIDVTANSQLRELDVEGNILITSLDVSQNTLLEKLGCSRNSLTAIDVSNNAQLTHLNCRDNQLSSLDISANAQLVVLTCTDNNLTVLDLSQAPDLQNLGCGINNLTSIDLSSNTELTSATLEGNQLTTINVTQNTKLRSLVVMDNNLTSISFPGSLPSLYFLRVENNQLSSLPLNALSGLEHLYISGNPAMPNLNFSLIPDLGWFYANDMAWTSVNLSQQAFVRVCQVGNSPNLTTLNLKNGNTAGVYWYSFNSLNCPKLFCVEVDDPVLADTTWRDVDAHTSFQTACSCTPLSAQSTVVDAACPSGNNGSISLVPQNGTAPHTYTWSSPSSIPVVTNATSYTGLHNEAYALQIQDANGCGGRDTVLVQGGPTIDLTVTDVSCDGAGDGSIALTSSGGVAPFTYNWNTGSSTGSIANLTPGTYTVTATDGTGCAVIASTLVGSPGPCCNGPYLSMSSNISACGGAEGIVEVVATGGTGSLLYTWSNGYTGYNVVGDLLNQVQPGTYTVTVEDRDECIAIDSIEVSGPVGITLTFSSTVATCTPGNDGTATVNATGGNPPYTYVWNAGGDSTAATNTGLNPATYSVTVADANGCTNNGATTVQPDGCNCSPISVAATSTAASCFPDGDGAANAVGSNGIAPYTYSWSNGGTMSTITSIASGTYTVTATDANGCDAVNSTNVLVAGASLPLPQLKAVDCGITLSTLNQYVHIQGVAGAQRYQYRITDIGTNATSFWFTPSGSPTATYLALSLVPGVQYGATYTVEVRVKIAGQWGCFGPACTLTTPASIPTTQLATAWCNGTVSALNTYFYWDYVVGAERYEVDITGPGAFAHTAYSLSQAPTATYLALSFIPNISYNTTYTVRVRARVNGVWAAFGNACTLSTPASPPVPVILASYCGNTLGSLNQQINFTGVPGASRYQHQVQADGGGSVLGSTFSPYYAPTITRFSMYFIPGIQASTPYDVSVRAKVNGVWQGYGPICSIATPVFKHRSTRLEAPTIEPALLEAMPNPTRTSSLILLGRPCDEVRATVRNAIGQVVLVEQFGSTDRFELQLPAASGLYFVAVDAQDGMLGQLKLIKQ